MFPLTQAASRAPSSSGTSISLSAVSFLDGQKAFSSLLPHSVFRADFKAVLWFPRQTQELGLGPAVQLIVQKCDSDLDFVIGEGAVLSFLGEERSLAKAFVTQYKCKPLSWRLSCDRRGFGQPHLCHLQHPRTCSCTRTVLHVSANHHCVHSHERAQQLFSVRLRTNYSQLPHSCLLLLWERIKNTWRARKQDLC